MKGFSKRQKHTCIDSKKLAVCQSNALSQQNHGSHVVGQSEVNGRRHSYLTL